MPASKTPTRSPSSRVEAGYPARPVQDLLAEHETLIARIKLSFGASRPSFAREVMPLIDAYADYVGWLPATASDFYDRPGGLFHLGLETAFYAVQGTDAHIFSGKLPISARRHLEPRWRRATFIAGLCGELHRAVSTMTVLDEGGAAWPALLQPLVPWLGEREAGHFHLRWSTPAGEVRSAGLLVLPLVVPRATLLYLAEDNEVVLPHLLASVGGLPLYRGRNVLDDLVRRAFALVVDRDLSARAGAGGAADRGRHQIRYLVEGLQRLVATESVWRPNQDKSRVWYAVDGLFLVWPGAGVDLHRLLEGEQIAGMPDGAEAILRCLSDAALIEASPEGEPIWRIRAPGADAPLDAIKLASAPLVLSALDHAPAAWPEPLAPVRATRLAARSPEPATAPAPAPEAAVQLPLTISAAEPEDATPADAPAAAPAGTPSGWRLKAPLRLNAAVRHALAALLAEPAPAIVADDDGAAVFVPLHLFDAYRIAPAIALRALQDVGMLAMDGPNATPAVRRHNAEGEAITGIKLKAGFVEALASTC